MHSIKVTDFLSMKLSFMHLVVLLFGVDFTIPQLLTLSEMQEALLDLSSINFQAKNECTPVFKGTWFPEINYVYTFCHMRLTYPENVMDDIYEIENVCTGYDCWESQLTEASKYDMLDTVNRFRQKVADGKLPKKNTTSDPQVVFELSWSDNLENFARSFIISYCNERKNLSDLIRFSYNETNPLTYNGFHTTLVYYSVVSFKLEHGLQKEMRSQLWEMLDQNYMNFWDPKQNNRFVNGLTFDMGCAFALRRSRENFHTTLDGYVQMGNEGILSCAFATFIDTLNVTIPGEVKTSHCTEIFSGFPNVIDENSLYPRLCKIKLPFKGINKPSMTCQLEENYLKSLCEKHLPFNKFSITWKERPYGYTLRFINESLFDDECNLPHPPQEDKLRGKNITYECTLQQEVFMEAIESYCNGWNCRSSQVKDLTKVNILNALNNARHAVASGQCPEKSSYCSNATYCNMAKLRWHWFLEKKAALSVRKCPMSSQSSWMEYEDHPFHEPVFFDQFSLQFDLPRKKGQSALSETFTKLFWNNTFQDWDENALFRRGNALFIGCSVVLRPHRNSQIRPDQRVVSYPDGILTNMVCIYAALKNNFSSELGLANDNKCCQTCKEPITYKYPCYAKTVKNISPFQNLCTSILLEYTMNCEINYCISTRIPRKPKNQISITVINQNFDGSFQVYDRLVSTDADYGYDDEENAAQGNNSIIFIVLFVIIFLICLLGFFVFKYYVKKKPFETTTQSTREKPLSLSPVKSALP